MVHYGDDPHTNPWHYKLVQPPKDRIWADPFILQRNERNYVFIEELLVSNNKGHIAVMELDDKGNTTQPVTVLEKDYHLSYPFVFEHDGDTWMIPESSAAQNLSLYRCTSFPNQWEFVMHLMEDIKIVDATLHQQDGLWWLFANVAAHPTLDKRDELHIYFAEDFRTSEWSAHPLNPVVSDVCTARPAGKLFYFEDKLIRPSQNSSHHYGYGYNLHEVQTLTTSQYQEHTMLCAHATIDA